MKEYDFGPHCIGNVLRILDKRTILVTTTDTLLDIGDTIQVYEIGPDIHDLEGHFLCRYEFIKDELEVKEINEHYCLCQKNKTRNVTKSSPLVQLSLSPLLGSTTTEYIPLKVLEEDIQPLTIEDPYIRVGNPIKLACKHP